MVESMIVLREPRGLATINDNLNDNYHYNDNVIYSYHNTFYKMYIIFNINKTVYKMYIF